MEYNITRIRICIEYIYVSARQRDAGPFPNENKMQMLCLRCDETGKEIIRKGILILFLLFVYSRAIACLLLLLLI